MPIEPRQLLAHRGCWTDAEGHQILAKNSTEAMSRARDSGFGIETDVRDRLGKLVIAHDPATASDPETDLSFIATFNGPVALNIKSDGLSNLLINCLSNTGPSDNYFFFDMSVPETIQFRKHGLPIGNRLSEFESLPDKPSSWIWLDSFNSEWYLDELVSLRDRLPNSKICIVSPELHGRPNVTAWSTIAKQMTLDKNLYLCTDAPDLFLNSWSKK